MKSKYEYIKNGADILKIIIANDMEFIKSENERLKKTSYHLFEGIDEIKNPVSEMSTMEIALIEYYLGRYKELQEQACNNN